MSERKSAQRLVREAVKDHGRKMKDFNGFALKILRDLDRDPIQAAAIAVRAQDALDEANKIFQHHCIRNNLQKWALDLQRPQSDCEEMLETLRQEQARKERVKQVTQTLEDLGAVTYYGRNMFRPTDSRLIDRRNFSAFSDRIPRDLVEQIDHYVETGEASNISHVCLELTRFTKCEVLRVRAREVELERELKYLGLSRRKDSTLCDAFVCGTSGKTASEVARVMAKFRYLYSGECKEFDKRMSRYHIRPYYHTRPYYHARSYDNYFSDDSSDEDEGALSYREYNQIRRELAAEWTDLPIVWPWLIHRVIWIQRRWREILANPYTKVGRKRLRCEFDSLTNN